MPSTYSFDPSGSLAANKITAEQHAITSVNDSPYHFIIPRLAPFFKTGLSVSYKNTSNATRTLVEGIDYILGYQFIGASRACAKPIYGAISFLDLSLTGTITLVYNTLGGDWVVDSDQINEVLSDTLRNPRVVAWEEILHVPEVFPPVNHQWNLVDLVGMSEVVDSLNDITQSIADKVITLDNSNVNKQSIGLGNVDNYPTASDQETIDGVLSTKFTTPHSVKMAIEAKTQAISTAAIDILEQNTGASHVVTPTGATLENTFIAYGTLQKLRDATAPDVINTQNVMAVVLGRTAALDGDVRFYKWDPYKLNADDSINIIVPSTNPTQGRWVLLSADKWKSEKFTATLSQPHYDMSFSPIIGMAPRIFVNRVLELKHRVDFDVSSNRVYFHFPLKNADLVHISLPVSKPSDNTPDNWIYKKFTVASPSQTFLLDAPVYDTDSVKVVLNELIVLQNNDDFAINGIYLNVSYPVDPGDEIEVVSLNNYLLERNYNTDPEITDFSTLVSNQEGNQLSFRGDGLYLGTVAPEDVETLYIDAINGSDSNTGTRASPLKTIKNALDRGPSGINRNIFLYERQTHYVDPGNRSILRGGKLFISSYGPTIDSMTNPVGGNKLYSQAALDLGTTIASRPWVLGPIQSDGVTQYQEGTAFIADNAHVVSYGLTFKCGVKYNSTNPHSAYTGSFISNDTSSSFYFIGCIINLPAAESSFGSMHFHSVDQKITFNNCTVTGPGKILIAGIMITVQVYGGNVSASHFTNIGASSGVIYTMNTNLTA